MKIDGHSFNQEWAWGKTQDEFVSEFKDMEHIFPEVADKPAKLKEVYALLQQGKPVDFKAPKAPVVKAAEETGAKAALASGPGPKPGELGKTS